jgi:hypothetical protein
MAPIDSLTELHCRNLALAPEIITTKNRSKTRPLQPNLDVEEPATDTSVAVLASPPSENVGVSSHPSPQAELKPTIQTLSWQERFALLFPKSNTALRPLLCLVVASKAGEDALFRDDTLYWPFVEFPFPSGEDPASSPVSTLEQATAPSCNVKLSSFIRKLSQRLQPISASSYTIPAFVFYDLYLRLRDP